MKCYIPVLSVYPGEASVHLLLTFEPDAARHVVLLVAQPSCGVVQGRLTPASR